MKSRSMAPASSSVIAPETTSPNKHIHYFHRRIFSYSHHSLPQPSSSRQEHAKLHTLDDAAQVPAGPEAAPPLATNPVPFMSEQLAPGPTGSTYTNSQPQAIQSSDIPGNVTAAAIVAVVVLGGLLGLVIGGEMLRRRAKEGRAVRSQGDAQVRFGCCRRRKSKAHGDVSRMPIEYIKAVNEKFAFDEKTLTPLGRPEPAVRRDHRGRLSDIWLLRNLSLRSHQTGTALSQKQQLPLAHSPRQTSPTIRTQTTWSNFTPTLLSVPSPKSSLPRIPEEPEGDGQSQTGSEIAITLGVALQRSLDSGSVLSAAPTVRSKSLLSMYSESFAASESQDAANQDEEDEQVTCKEDTCEDSKSLGSAPPDMTVDGGSTRSSSSSLRSIDTELEAQSLKGEVFELRRVQTRSMQMNKGVLLSLSVGGLQHIGDAIGSVVFRDECPASSRCVAGDHHDKLDLGSSSYADSLATMAESYSAIDLDEFPSPPSILPMIPSFASVF
ncbi:hypothetical protein HYDPIDRAFT_107353 [Hydnomerulius pinastri MD-312]|nr:hypothetical protein HYDPIDRAFT_107353 [Hydnomerulius pinastri MD-312]